MSDFHISLLFKAIFVVNLPSSVKEKCATPKYLSSDQPEFLGRTFGAMKEGCFMHFLGFSAKDLRVVQLFLKPAVLKCFRG